LSHRQPDHKRAIAVPALALCSALLMALPAFAAEVRQPLPDAHALIDVRVVTAPGETLESATIVIRDGIIEAVGDVAVPADAAVIEFERGEDQPPITVYPGLIEPYLVVASDDADEASESPPGRHPLIRPTPR
jgi:imidazolonepropionase-like amidohydrolase